MPLAQYAINDDLLDSLGVAPSTHAEVLFVPYGTHDSRVEDGNVLLGAIGPIRAQDLTDPYMLDEGPWTVTISTKAKTSGWRPVFQPITVTFEHDHDISWGEIVAGVVTDIPFTPTLLQQAEDAADAATTAAASVQREQANGVAGLTSDGKLYMSRIPDLSATYAGKATRRAALTFGSAGDNTGTSAGKWNPRYPGRLPVSPTRFRIKVANYDVRNFGAYAATATPLAAVWLGTHDLDATTGEMTGKMSGTPVNLSISGTIPADGTYLTSGWITDPAALALVEGGKPFILSLAINNDATSRNAVRTWGRGYFSFSANDVAVLAPTLSRNEFTLFDMQIEYDYGAAAGQRPVVMSIGDSLTSGGGFPGGVANPDIMAYPSQLSQLAQCGSINLGEYGSTTSLWTSGASKFWTRADLATFAPDVAVIHLGTNDVAASVTLATYQANMKQIIANARAYASVKRVFLCTIPPRNYAGGSASEILRVSYNSWLRTQPFGVAGVIDLDVLVRNPANPLTILSEYDSGDGVHFNPDGYGRIAQALAGVAAPIAS